jgi:hypothetical protein
VRAIVEIFEAVSQAAGASGGTMKFTLLAYAPSALLIALSLMGSHTKDMRASEALVGGFGVVLLLPTTMIVALYWIVRLVKYAWRDQSQPVAEPSSSGRIFGPLQ